MRKSSRLNCKTIAMQSTPFRDHQNCRHPNQYHLGHHLNQYHFGSVGSGHLLAKESSPLETVSGIFLGLPAYLGFSFNNFFKLTKNLVKYFSIVIVFCCIGQTIKLTNSNIVHKFSVQSRPLQVVYKP